MIEIGVPTITGGDEDGIDVVSGEKFAKVAVCGAVGIAVMIVHLGFSGQQTIPPNVAHRYELGFFERLEVRHYAGTSSTMPYGGHGNPF